MSVREQQCLFVLEGIQPFELTIPGLDILLTFHLCGDLDEIFCLQILEVTELLMIDFDLIEFMFDLWIVLF